MCGFKSPFYFTSTKERIWIRFKSDGSLSNRGFVAGYVTYDLDSREYWDSQVVSTN